METGSQALLNKRFSPARQSAMDARFEAQKIAFGPVVFQCVRIAWKRGILQRLAETGERGLSVDELAVEGKLSRYALNLLLETCLSAGVVELREGRYALDKTGYCLLSDAIAQINFDFIHDVCYQGLFALERSLDEEKPHGLAALGPWDTLYQGLAAMQEPARSSWLSFDHYYSDTSFPEILPDVFARRPRKLMDIGANTGKFTLAALAYDAEVEMHLLDLPGQLAVIEKTLAEKGLSHRAQLHPTDMLNPALDFPAGMDVIWMSQFLSCFSEEVIASILRRAAAALAEGGQVMILDTLWDRQKYDIAAYCLINTSPYFTAMASGNSKIYRADDYIRLCREAGLALAAERDGIGYCHSLLQFERKA
ncbi:class I SAM-dependent methyltransferase [Chromobacterium alticapitis]|uniref:SAM-dependent methyltransferase n=1 Tax=Chromobacterium alticapitis TaxID=2073169 RepID=A0A2S5DDF2_9NEIS|nr:class I SAM-dependent methyltransferase [Chromobacterium alticapitis]POZ61116.1 SAM-dependent methyltransferase [Chromobacterium alticapitis]